MGRSSGVEEQVSCIVLLHLKAVEIRAVSSLLSRSKVLTMERLISCKVREIPGHHRQPDSPSLPKATKRSATGLPLTIPRELAHQVHQDCVVDSLQSEQCQAFYVTWGTFPSPPPNPAISRIPSQTHLAASDSPLNPKTTPSGASVEIKIPGVVLSIGCAFRSAGREHQPSKA